MTEWQGAVLRAQLERLPRPAPDPRRTRRPARRRARQVPASAPERRPADGQPRPLGVRAPLRRRRFAGLRGGLRGGADAARESTRLPLSQPQQTRAVPRRATSPRAAATAAPRLPRPAACPGPRRRRRARSGSTTGSCSAAPRTCSTSPPRSRGSRPAPAPSACGPRRRSASPAGWRARHSAAARAVPASGFAAAVLKSLTSRKRALAVPASTAALSSSSRSERACRAKPSPRARR